jgi:four helix bundle protein
MKKGAIQEKSFSFALEIIFACRSLAETSHEYVLSRQLMKSGTAIGAMVREAEEAESKADFIHKMAIALKEARETGYWLDLLSQTGLITEELSINSKLPILSN